MTNPITPKKNTAKNISRRDFLKLSGAAAGAASSIALPKIHFPTFLRQAKIELNMLSWFWQEAGRSDAWRMMIQKFHETQSDIHINEGGSGFNEYMNTMVIQAKSGKIDGDLYCATPDLFVRLMRAGHTISLEDVVKKAGVTLSKAQDILRKDGEVNGLDIVTVSFGLLYNKKMYDKAGLVEPTSIDEWVAGATALTDRPNQFGIFGAHMASEPGDVWFNLAQWVVLYDGVLAEGKNPLFTSDAVIKGMKLFKTMYDNAMPQGTESPTAIKMLGASKIAQQMIVSPAVNIWKTDTEDPELYGNLRSAKPFWPGGKSVTRIHPICVNPNTEPEKQAAAKEFLSWLYQKENYQQLLEGCLDLIPAIEGGIRKEYRDSLTWADGYDAVTPITVPEVLGEFVLFNNEFGEVFLPHFQDILTGSASVEDAMAAAQTEAEELGARVFA